MWSSAPASAQLGVTPRVLAVDPTHTITEVSISSLRARPVIFDTLIEQWEQRGSDDTYTPSRSFVAVPSVFSVSPYATQLLRLAMRTPVFGAREMAYRVRIVEVVAGNATPPASARTFSIPLFVAPAKAEGDVRYELHRRSETGYDVVVRNDSNVHTYIATLALDGQGQELYAGKVGAFVLAGNARTIPVTLRAPLVGPATLRIEAEGGITRSISVQSTP